jgi:hypothetical protein
VDYPPFSEEKEGKEEELPPFSTLPDPSLESFVRVTSCC